MASLTERVAVAPRAVFLMLGGLLAGALYMGTADNIDYDAEIKNLQQDLQTKNNRIKTTKIKLEDRQKFADEVATVNQTFRAALEYLPNKLDMQDLLKSIYSEGRTAGVQLTNFKPKETIAKDFYEEIPMEIQVTGSFAQITSFLANVSKLPRIINIRNVGLGQPRLIDNTPLLRLEGTLVAYRYKEAK